MEHEHFILNKPYGYLSQFVNNTKTRKNKKLLGELYDFPDGTMAVGRLDEDSEGLLILTTDGKLSHTLRDNSVEKEYYVQVDGIITKSAIDKMCKGVEIGFEGKKYVTNPCTAHKIDVPEFEPRRKPIRSDRHGPTSWVSVTITEGKFRQVKKMTAAVNFPTLRLVRVRIGEIYLEDLKQGEVKVLDL